MSLAELKQQVRDLPAAERSEFVFWAIAHEDELVEPPPDETIAPEVMEELLRRRDELDQGNVKLHSIEEMESAMSEAIDEVRRSRH